MGNLKERLEQRKTEFKQNAPADAVQLMGRATDDLANSGILETVLNEGDTAPEFSLTDHSGNQISSVELLKNGPLVIHFFRGGW